MITLFVASCKKNNVENSYTISNNTESSSNQNPIKVLTDNNGAKLELKIDNSEGTAIANFNGEQIVLKQVKGKNENYFTNGNYELRANKNDILLQKDSVILFSHTDDLIKNRLKSKLGQTLDLTFNNTTNTVKIYLDGGEQIELNGMRNADGILYKDNQYELRGKGENLTLKKGRKVLFTN